MFAVVDGLGHGPMAELAATAATRALEAIEPGTSIEACFSLAGKALKGTRGAAMTVVRIAGDQLEVAGVGNVGCRGVGMSMPIIATPGVLGHSHRQLRVGRCAVPRRGRFVLHSDGLPSSSDLGSLDADDAGRACEEAIQRFAVAHDDATVLVVDLGPTLR